MNALRKPPPRGMTVAEFPAWAGTCPERWCLRDGAPEMMVPAGERHGYIRAELAALLRDHLAAHRPDFRVAVGAGVIPATRADRTMLVPDLAVTCAPPGNARALPAPVLLVEVLSPSNAPRTQANVTKYQTIPSVAEILVIASAAAGATLHRRDAGGEWPATPEQVGPAESLHLDSIGFAAPLREAYRTTDLAGAPT